MVDPFAALLKLIGQSDEKIKETLKNKELTLEISKLFEMVCIVVYVHCTLL